MRKMRSVRQPQRSRFRLVLSELLTPRLEIWQAYCSGLKSKNMGPDERPYFSRGRPTFGDFGRLWPDVGRCWPGIVQSWSTLIDLGKILSYTWSDVGQLRATSVLAKFANIERVRPNSVRCWPNLALPWLRTFVRKPSLKVSDILKKLGFERRFRERSSLRISVRSLAVPRSTS